jgi:Protein of unknown function (DUF2950)
MTFVVGPKGRVFQKDLGETSEDAMKAMVFDPDSTSLIIRVYRFIIDR